jgi:hypothetical protein
MGAGLQGLDEEGILGYDIRSYALRDMNHPRRVGSATRITRVFATGALAIGLGIALGADPSYAQQGSTITINFPTSPDTTLVNTNGIGGTAEGSVTFQGTGVATDPIPPDPNQTGFFAGVKGIEFINNAPAYSFSGEGIGVSSYFGFSPFYLIGTCEICKGSTNEKVVTVDQAFANGTTTVFPVSSTSEFVTTSTGPGIPITFGNSGPQSGNRGTITFFAQALVQGDANAAVGAGIGSVGLAVLPGVGVPGPLPILGASTAFAFSRKLRRRVTSAKAVIPSV